MLQGPTNILKLELCAFALKGEHNVYSLVPNIAVCMYRYIYILIPSCSQPAVGSNIVQITHISGHFRSIRNFIFLEIFDKMAAFGPFGCPKFTLDRISGHFRSIGHFGFQKLTNKIFVVDQRHC